MNELKLRNAKEILNESSVFREQELNLLRDHAMEAEKARSFAEQESQSLYKKIEFLEQRKVVGK